MVLSALYTVLLLLYLPNRTHTHRTEENKNNEFGIQKEPVELFQLPCVVQVQGRQPAVVGQLEEEKDDRVQVQLEDRKPVIDMDLKHQ